MAVLTFLFSSIVSEMNIRVIAIIYLNSITTSLSRLLFINVKPVNETVPKKRRKKDDCYSGRKRKELQG